VAWRHWHKSSKLAFLSAEFAWLSELGRPVRAPLGPHVDYDFPSMPHLPGARNRTFNAEENVMLQANEIQQRFTQIQQTIQNAEQVCRSQQDAPNEIRDCIDKLSRESQQAQNVMQSNDQQQMVQCVDKLESISDEAKRVSRSNPQMAQPLQQAVMQVHDELSNLKHQLH
jgi:hypothetical protein